MEADKSEPTIGELLAPMFTPEALKAERDSSHADLMAMLGLDATDEAEEPSVIPLSNFKLLPENPKKADARAFVESCLNQIGIGFHPDTDFAEYVHGASGRQMFNRTDSLALNWQIVRAGELLQGEEDDVYGICVNHAQRWYAETHEGVDPAVEVKLPETE